MGEAEIDGSLYMNWVHRALGLLDKAGGMDLIAKKSFCVLRGESSELTSAYPPIRKHMESCDFGMSVRAVLWIGFTAIALAGQPTSAPSNKTTPYTRLTRTGDRALQPSQTDTRPCKSGVEQKPVRTFW